MSSRLCLGLRESLGWVYDIHSSYQAYRAAGTVVVEGACATENLRQTLGKTLFELMEIAHEGVSEEELRRTKLQIRGQHQLASDSIHTRMSRGLTQQHYFGRTLSEDEVIEGFESVTCDQVQRVAQEMVASQKLGLTVFGDCDKSGTAEQLQELLHDSLVSQLT